MKQTKIFTIGGSTFDIFIRPKDHHLMNLSTEEQRSEFLCLPYGEKVRIDQIEESFGGGGTNTAVSFSRMGFDVQYVGKVGSQYGDRVIENLRQQGVNTEYVAKTKKDQTGFSTILNTFHGDRTVLAYSGANKLFNVKDLPLKELETADWVFLNHLSEKNSKIPAALLKVLKKNPHIKLAWNPGKEQLEQGVAKWKELLKRTEVLFVNKEEAALFTKTKYYLRGLRGGDSQCPVHIPKTFLPPYADDVTEIMMKLFKYGAKNVVITDGTKGAQASDGKRLFFCPVVTPKRVDTTGAGDAFGSGFTSALILGEGLKTALKYGTLNAYSVIHESGAQSGLLTREELQKKLKKVDICVTSTKIT